MSKSFCSFCGARFTPIEKDGTVYCPVCKAKIKLSTTPPPSKQPEKGSKQIQSIAEMLPLNTHPTCATSRPRYSPPKSRLKTSPKPHKPAWEEKGNRFNSFFRTIGQVLFVPYDTFKEPFKGSLKKPVLFYLVFSIFLLIIPFTIFAIHRDFVSFAAISLITIILGSIILILYGLYLHLFLKLFKAGANGVKSTIRVTLYSTALCIIYIVPMVGYLIFVIWHIIMSTNSLAATHQTAKPRTFLAIICANLVGLFLLILSIGFLSLIKH
ncbi:YIP1 family protein [Dethiosulfatarculus sandiegensis]|uniref:YIP1 family protein n=1 Tax=Dethiosulfatarculus sandiegensis TaxID=1429043 RepID=UPI0012E1BA63|nr:YIP1 family protein [Dethiosulfatarculus sandiegensis]